MELNISNAEYEADTALQQVQNMDTRVTTNYQVSQRQHTFTLLPNYTCTYIHVRTHTHTHTQTVMKMQHHHEVMEV